jgi:hypothetical protein
VFGALTVIIALFLYGLGRRDVAKMPFALTLASSIAFFVVPVGIRGTEHVAPEGGSLTYAGSRYVIVPVLLLMSMSLMVLGRRDHRFVSRTWRAIQVTLMLFVSVVVVSNYRATNLRAAGPAWDSELLTAEHTCEAKDIEFARIPISPPGAGFNILAPCDRVQQQHD